MGGGSCSAPEKNGVELTKSMVLRESLQKMLIRANVLSRVKTGPDRAGNINATIQRRLGKCLLPLLLAVVSGVCFSGCNPEDRRSARAGYYDTNVLAGFFREGVTQEDVVKRFGSPTSQFETGDGGWCLEYMARVRGRTREPHEVVGFQAVWLDNEWVRWSPVYSRP
jgi:hypothetical protein